jgi:anti-anti-sigma regulatory factor
VVADLSRVEFMESVSLGMLIEQRNELRDSGKELALVIQGGAGDSEEHPVGRLLGLTGQAGEFSVYDSRVVAVEDLASKS